MRQDSSLFSSAKPIVFIQNENGKGLFLGLFLVKIIEVFSLSPPFVSLYFWVFYQFLQ